MTRVWLLGALLAAAYPFASFMPALEPHTLQGLAGILAAPFVHTGLPHLTTNLVLSSYLLWLLRDDPLSYVVRAIVFIVLVSGLLTWAFGRAGNHAGASGLVIGLMLLVACLLDYRQAAIVVAVCAGAAAYDMLVGRNVSWELHLSGCIAGVLFAALGRSTKEYSYAHRPTSTATAPRTSDRRPCSRPYPPGAGRRADP